MVQNRANILLGHCRKLFMDLGDAQPRFEIRYDALGCDSQAMNGRSTMQLLGVALHDRAGGPVDFILVGHYSPSPASSFVTVRPARFARKPLNIKALLQPPFSPYPLHREGRNALPHRT